MNQKQRSQLPVLDPLRECAEAMNLYDKLSEISYAQKLMLAMHVIDGRKHDPGCPAHDPTLVKELRSQLGLDKLPDN